MHRGIFIIAMQMTLEVPVLASDIYSHIFFYKNWASYNVTVL